MASIVVEIVGDEVIERPMTPQEQEQRKVDEQDAAQAAQAAEAEAALRVSAREKIAAASGLTPDEMRALGFAV